LRNPWGTFEWTGDWSDKSTKWTPELKKQLNFVAADDGIFWMPVEDFCKFYAEVSVNHLYDNYCYAYRKFDFSKTKVAMIKLQVQKNTHGYVSIC